MYNPNDPSHLPPVYQDRARRDQPFWQKFKKVILGPLIALGVILGKFKSLLVPVLKFFPAMLKTGGTMFLSIWAYALLWGWWFAAGFVILLFVHECGHLLAARRIGLKVGAPVFIPFMGAFIALKEAPKNAWVEAQVGIGGPLLGSIGAALFYLLYPLTGNPVFAAVAYSGFFLNLFNLAPLTPLDGGRIVTALSPWLWVAGVALLGVWMFIHPNFIILLVIFFSLPRLFSLFRRRTLEEVNYFQVTPVQRWIIGVLYFGLAAFLAWGMKAVQLQLHRYVQH